jgi:type VI secretion system protein ImpG
MSEDLLTYYNRELTWFRQALERFAEAHPTTAGNLRISADSVEDPHTSRLIESVAFLNARIQSRLDDDFPLVVSALLEHLYPFYLAPKPSLLLAEMKAGPGLDSATLVPAGQVFETDTTGGVSCRFRTCYPVALTPLSIGSAELLAKPFSTPGADAMRRANAVLAIGFESSVEEFSLAEEEQDTLVFHIKPNQHAWQLHDLLYKDCLGLALASSELDPSPTLLGPDHLQPVGMAANERILPDPGDSESHYQLLAEYFFYGEKFLFFRVSGLRRALADRSGNFQLYIYLADSNRELESALDKKSFALHATPMINLFEINAEPGKISPEIPEYQVVPQSSAIGDMEVYAVTQVTLIGEGGGEQKPVPPYYGLTHDAGVPYYWHGSRRASLAAAGRKNAVTDYFLSLSRLNGEPPDDSRQTMHIRALCSNGNLPGKLPYGGGQPRLSPSEPISGLKEAKSISPPTPARRLDLGRGLVWRLLSHLNLNYLSLVGSKDPAEQLREMLRLYDHGDSPALRSQINALDSLQTRIISLPMAIDGRPVVCRGVDIEIMFDPSLQDTGSALLFGAVLMQFLSGYVNLNSFVRLTVRIKGRDGNLFQWEPVVGRRPVI